MKQTVFLSLTLILLLSACAAPVAPAPTPDIPATVAFIAETMIASTLTAMPTATLAPTHTPAPSATPTETLTPTLLPVDFDATMVALTPTATNTPLQGSFGPTLNPDYLSLMLLINQSDYSSVRLQIYCLMKPTETPVYFEYVFTTSMSFNIPFGSCTYTAILGDKKTFKGAFTINNYDKTTMRFYSNKVVIAGP